MMTPPTASNLLATVAVSLAATLCLAPSIALADPAPKIVKKVPPDFPGEATRKGITDGVLKAKLSIDGNGAVTEVAILEATPAKAKIFKDAASSALNQWKFEASGKPTSYELKLVFSQE
jgi:outer membrane biosynthesis protein TonB